MSIHTAGRPMGRRAALRALGLSALGLALGAGPAGCGGGRVRRHGTSFRPPPGTPRRFARVKVAWSRVIRTVVGLRPYRPSGFVLRSEKLDDTLVVHDYGHGGGGVTLSWGTAHLAVEEALLVDARR